MLAATKADLQNAPAFRYTADVTRASTNSNANAPTFSTPSPAAMPPAPVNNGTQPPPTAR